MKYFSLLIGPGLCASMWALSVFIEVRHPITVYQSVIITLVCIVAVLPFMINWKWFEKSRWTRSLWLGIVLYLGLGFYVSMVGSKNFGGVGLASICLFAAFLHRFGTSYMLAARSR